MAAKKATNKSSKSKAPEISAVICTYDRYDLLTKAIQSCLDQDLDKASYRIIIVDNSPDLERAKEEQQKYDGIDGLTYLIEEIAGLSNARNVAARECGTKYISYLDDDAIASPQWLRKTLEAFKAFPDEAGIVGGTIEPIWGRPRPNWLPDELLGSLTVVDWGGALRIAGDNEWVAGANISFLVEPLLEIGGFPVALGRVGSGNVLMSNEEIHVLEHFKEKGLSVVYSPEASVQHLVDERRLSQSWLRKRMAWQAVSDFMKNPDAVAGEASKYWEGVVWHFNSIKPDRRSPRGFFAECDDPQEFKSQVGSVYNLTMALLAGLNLPEE